MKIFENYNTAKQKYGEELANSVLSNGIPNEYVYTACRYYTEDNIPIDVLQQKFRQWMSYIRNLGKETFNINNLSYQQFDNIIRDEIQKAMKPNPIYDDGTIFMGEFKTKEDALLYPIPNEWCTSNSSSKYNQYVGDGYRLFVIENKSLDEPLKYVCASVYNGRVIYWDVNDNQLYEDLRDYTNVNNSEHETYQRTLPKQIVDYLYNIAAEQTDEIENKQNINCNRNMNKKLIRLTESDLHRIVKESVNRVLNEWEYAGWVNDIGDDYDDEPDEPKEYDFDTKIWGLADKELPEYLEKECNRLGLYFKGFSCPKGGESFYKGFIRDRDGKEYAEITIEVKQQPDQL